MEAILYAEVYLICSVILGLIYGWSVSHEEKSTADLWLNRTYFCFLLNFLSNFFFTLMNRIWVFEPAVDILSYAFKTLYLLTLTLGVFCWCGYAETTMHSIFLLRKKPVWVSYCALAAICLFIFSNLFTRSIFFMDEEHQYHRTALFQAVLALLAVISSICSFRILFRIGKESDPSRRSHFRIISSFPICILASLALSFIGETVPVICVCILVDLLCIYVANNNQQICTDILTRVNNRQNLNRFMVYKLMNYDEQVWLMMIDVDHFKPINDTFGHLEGDAALERISNVLKEACRVLPSRPFIARYGGDEFVIVLEGPESETRLLCDTIHAMLKESDQEGKPYQLRVSIGIAKRKCGMTYEQLVAEADEALYEVKKNRLPWTGYTAAN